MSFRYLGIPFPGIVHAYDQCLLYISFLLPDEPQELLLGYQMVSGFGYFSLSLPYPHSLFLMCPSLPLPK